MPIYAVDITDTLRTIDIYLKNIPGWSTSTGGNKIKRVDADYVADIILHDIFELDAMGGLESQLDYVKHLLGENFMKIHSMLTDVVIMVFKNQSQDFFHGVEEIEVTSYGSVHIIIGR